MASLGDLANLWKLVNLDIFFSSCVHIEGCLRAMAPFLGYTAFQSSLNPTRQLRQLGTLVKTGWPHHCWLSPRQPSMWAKICFSICNFSQLYQTINWLQTFVIFIFPNLMSQMYQMINWFEPFTNNIFPSIGCTYVKSGGGVVNRALSLS